MNQKGETLSYCSLHDTMCFDMVSLFPFKADLFYRNLQLIVVDSVASVITPILGGQQIQGRYVQQTNKQTQTQTHKDKVVETSYPKIIKKYQMHPAPLSVILPLN